MHDESVSEEGPTALVSSCLQVVVQLHSVGDRALLRSSCEDWHITHVLPLKSFVLPSCIYAASLTSCMSQDDCRMEKLRKASTRSYKGSAAWNMCLMTSLEYCSNTIGCCYQLSRLLHLMVVAVGPYFILYMNTSGAGCAMMPFQGGRLHMCRI